MSVRIILAPAGTRSVEVRYIGVCQSQQPANLCAVVCRGLVGTPASSMVEYVGAFSYFHNYIIIEYTAGLFLRACHETGLRASALARFGGRRRATCLRRDTGKEIGANLRMSTTTVIEQECQ